jgi:hypothetical protein
MNRESVFFMSLAVSLMFLLSFVGCVQESISTESPLSPLATVGQTATPIATRIPTIRETDTPDPTVSPLIISSVSRDDNDVEIITIKNISDEEQSLKRKTLLYPETMANIELPSEVVLGPGESFQVFNGIRSTNSSSNGLVWQDAPLLQEKGDRMALLNEAGRVLWNYVKRENNP